jgi:predicted NAD/FAD-binding protein
MLKEIFAFNRICKEDLKSGALCGSSFEEYLAERRFSERLRDDYLVPMTAAIWSTPPKRMLEFPAESLIRFLDNHRLIHKHSERPNWRTVKGGSRNYVDKLLAAFTGKIVTGNGVKKVIKRDNGIELVLMDGKKQIFDEVVIATHSDQALALLDTPNAEQKTILGSIEYKPNVVYLHRDKKLMPKRKAAWSAWNYMGARSSHGQRDLSVTYWMNRLQHIDDDTPLFVSLNPETAPDREKTFQVFNYDHPQFDQAAISAQLRLPEIQGQDGLWFCGAWTKYGFHEDGLASGLKVARELGATIPFETAPENPDISAQGKSAHLQAAE